MVVMWNKIKIWWKEFVRKHIIDDYPEHMGKL